MTLAWHRPDNRELLLSLRDAIRTLQPKLLNAQIAAHLGLSRMNFSEQLAGRKRVSIDQICAFIGRWNETHPEQPIGLRVTGAVGLSVRLMPPPPPRSDPPLPNCTCSVRLAPGIDLPDCPRGLANGNRYATWDEVPNDVLLPDAYEARNGHSPPKCPVCGQWMYEYQKGVCGFCEGHERDHQSQYGAPAPKCSACGGWVWPDIRCSIRPSACLRWIYQSGQCPACDHWTYVEEPRLCKECRLVPSVASPLDGGAHP